MEASVGVVDTTHIAVSNALLHPSAPFVTGDYSNPVNGDFSPSESDYTRFLLSPDGGLVAFSRDHSVLETTTVSTFSGVFDDDPRAETHYQSMIHYELSPSNPSNGTGALAITPSAFTLHDHQVLPDDRSYYSTSEVSYATPSTGPSFQVSYGVLRAEDFVVGTSSHTGSQPNPTVDEGMQSSLFLNYFYNHEPLWPSMDADWDSAQKLA